MKNDEVHAVADELAIRNLVARVAHVTDGGDLADYATVYCDDAVSEMSGTPAVHGLDAIVASAGARRSSGVLGPGSNTRHVVSTTEIELTGDAAHGESCWVFYGTSESGPVVRAVGMYQDTYRRTPDGWKVAHRRIRPG